ncbi:MAG: DUF1573 domain-containing protein [Bacteroidales bacterium]
MMKKFVFAALILATICILNHKTFAQSGSVPKFEYKAEDNRMVLDTIYLDWIDDVQLDVEFVNKGDKPLIVQNVTGCCGTQIPDWTKKPILPGEKGTITVEFRVPPRPHKISRTVRAITNDPDGAKLLHIEGIVAEPKEEGTITLQKKES